MKIGIYGGMFNPPHIGHISALKSYIKKIKLDRAIIVPCGKPSHKTVEKYISDEDRFAMCSLAFSDFAEINDFEMKNEGLSYTVNTLKYFKEIYPDDELYILIGDDMLASFDSWYQPETICKLCSVCYISRGVPDAELEIKAAELEEKYHGRFIEINCKPVIVSSSEIRSNINDEKINSLLTEEVYGYIKGRNLYND